MVLCTLGLDTARGLYSDHLVDTGEGHGRVSNISADGDGRPPHHHGRPLGSGDRATSATTTATVTVTAVPVLSLTTSGTPPYAITGTGYTLMLSPGGVRAPPTTTPSSWPQSLPGRPSRRHPPQWLALRSHRLDTDADLHSDVPLDTRQRHGRIAISPTAASGTYTTTATLSDTGDRASPATPPPPSQ